MKRFFSLLLIVFFATATLVAQEPTPPPDDDINALFTEESGDETFDPATDEPDLISDFFEKGITFGAEFSIIAGYSPGLRFPEDDASITEITYADLALVKLSAAITANVRFSPEFRFFVKLSAKTPSFEPEIAELFCDYSLLNTVYFRIGRQTISWGISPTYPFTNLMARIPDPLAAAIDLEKADSVAARVTIPFGVGGWDLVAFTRVFAEPAPQILTIDTIGAGTHFNLALPNFDFTLGGFYHKALDLRFYYSLKTTLFDTVEVYTEGLTATNVLKVADPAIASWYFSANAGVYFDLFAEALKINAEYFYCGEQSELTVKGARFQLFPGHNVALNLSLDIVRGKFKFLLQGNYNFAETSGLIIPALTLDVLSDITFSLAVPFVVGPVAGGYFQGNTELNNRRVSLVLAVILDGKI